MSKLGIIINGLIKENPTFVLLLGMCPTLGTTSSAFNGMSMGLATMVVLILANIVISAIARFIPDKVHIPCDKSLGIFIPLIVVNCIVLGRAESFACKNGVIDSACDGIGIGLGFTIALTILGACREFLGTGAIFGLGIMPENYGALTFVLAPGAFITLAYLSAIFNKLFNK